MNRGFSCIALDNPKCAANIGGAMRAAHVYGADMIVIGGPRYQKFKRFSTDVTKAYKHIPTLEPENILDVIPHDCVPIAVDLIEGAISLPRYTHPERAFYIFGAEDQTLGKRITDRCRDVIYIPTKFCMNLAATVNVVLYDRIAKRNEWLVPSKWQSAAE